jgi:hypothetical protein
VVQRQLSREPAAIGVPQDEMVCDWTTMAQEFGQDGGSARGWADRTIGKRIAFNADKRRFIDQIIEELDRQIAANP